MGWIGLKLIRRLFYQARYEVHGISDCLVNPVSSCMAKVLSNISRPACVQHIGLIARMVNSRLIIEKAYPEVLTPILVI